jgi:hypothetical protein
MATPVLWRTLDGWGRAYFPANGFIAVMHVAGASVAPLGAAGRDRRPTRRWPDAVGLVGGRLGRTWLAGRDLAVYSARNAAEVPCRRQESVQIPELRTTVQNPEYC